MRTDRYCNHLVASKADNQLKSMKKTCVLMKLKFDNLYITGHHHCDTSAPNASVGRLHWAIPLYIHTGREEGGGGGIPGLPYKNRIPSAEVIDLSFPGL